MNVNKIRNEYFEEMASTFKLLSSPVKLKLINFISFCPRSVEDCAHKFNQSVQNISLHLITLAKAGILDVDKVKNYRYYSLSSNPIAELVSNALMVDSRTLLSEELLYENDYSFLANEIINNKVKLIDLRSSDEASYLPVNKTLHFTENLSSITNLLNKVPKSKPLVFFCKGRMCERLYEAVSLASGTRQNVKGLALSAAELKDFSGYLNF